MPAPRWLKISWKGCCACGRGCSRLVRWTLWLLLLLGAGIQVFILSTNELRVPGFVLRELESQLTAAGLSAEFGRITFDPSGRLLLRETEVSLQPMDTTVLRARAVFLKVDPFALWRREVVLQEARLIGVELLLPAAISPSGREEPLVRDLHATLRPDSGRLELREGTAHLGPLPISATGSIALPATDGEPDTPWTQRVPALRQAYLQACRQIADFLPRLPALEHPRLHLQFEPVPDHGANIDLQLDAARIILPAPDDPAAAVTLHQARLHTRWLPGPRPELPPVTLDIAAISAPADLTLEGLHATLDLDPAAGLGLAALGDLHLQLDRVRHPLTAATSIALHTRLDTLPVVQTAITTRFAGEPWHLDADLDITQLGGQVTLTGDVGIGTTRLAGELTGVDVPALLSWHTPPHLSARLDLASGGRLLQATAHFQTEAVVARRVALDATAARVHWDGAVLDVPRLTLQAGPNRASGSYRMDTQSREFTFLLNGRLDPPAIAGWFKDWWPRFWQTFQFAGAPPDASAEISGVWGDPQATRVFVSATADHPTIRDIAMQRMRTRLFIRPGWADILHFESLRDEGTVTGRFARQWKMPDGRRWTRIEIDASGHTDLSPVPKLMPGSGDDLVAPFTLTQPVKVSLQGAATRADRGAPLTQDFTIHVSGQGPWRFYDLPLENLDLVAHRATGLIRARDVVTRFAGGEVTGQLEISGEGDDRKLAFDLNLEDAELARAVQEVSAWRARRHGEEPPPASAFARQSPDGRLDVALTATGPARDLLSLQGAGSAAIRDANLANINLLGVLSALLKRTILNFSTLQLSHANANFELAGPELKFPELKITGRRGAVDATGTYSLADGTLDFNTRVRPFEGGEGLLDAVFTPLMSVLEVKLTGELSDPAWTFVFGPTNLLRNLTGENTRARSATPTEPDESAPADSAPTAPAPPPDPDA